MIRYEEISADGGRLAAEILAMPRYMDEWEAMAANLQRLVALIDDTMPRTTTVAEFEAAEESAAKVIRHLVIFEHAWFGRRRTAGVGFLFGLSLGGVSTSSSTCRAMLLRNWQRTARQRIAGLT